jgi:hypothetical protein
VNQWLPYLRQLWKDWFDPGAFPGATDAASFDIDMPSDASAPEPAPTPAPSPTYVPSIDAGRVGGIDPRQFRRPRLDEDLLVMLWISYVMFQRGRR